MQVLVSVTNAREAQLAAAAQIPWIDLKAPQKGPLGAASPELQQEVVDCQLPGILSLACGEIEQSFTKVVPGFHFAKLGLSNLQSQTDWEDRWQCWADQLPNNCTPVVVSYADWSDCQGLPLDQALDFARARNLQHVLVDTFDKQKDGLLAGLPKRTLFSDSVPVSHLEDEIQQALHRAAEFGVTLVWAGKLTREDAEILARMGADIAGFRSAVCQQQRTGAIDSEKLFALADRQGAWSSSAPPQMDPVQNRVPFPG